MFKLFGFLISLIIISTFACSSQGDDFQSLRTLDKVRTERAQQIQIQEDPPASNGFLQAGPSYHEIQLASDRFYSDKAWQIDSSYREAKRQIEQSQVSCYNRLSLSNVAHQSIGTICDFSYQLQELEKLVDMDYNSLWNQVRAFENEASSLGLGSRSFDVQARLEDEWNWIAGTSIDPYRYENEIQQDVWLKEESISRAESECESGGSGIHFLGGSIECENDDPFGINNSYDSGFGLGDRDCESWDFDCQRSDPFGINNSYDSGFGSGDRDCESWDFDCQRSDPFGQQPDSFGERSDPFGQQPDPFGQQPDSFGERSDPFGQQK